MYDFVAQLVEHFPFKEGVLSSNLSKITFKILFFFLIFSCTKKDKDEKVQLSEGVFGKKEVLSCQYLEETLGKELDEKIDEWRRDVQKPAE